jgi:hypothetical protein
MRPIGSSTALSTATATESTTNLVQSNTNVTHSPSDNGTEGEDEATLFSFC